MISKFVDRPPLKSTLQVQPIEKVRLRQTCHEIAEKSSKIVSLGAPFFSNVYASITKIPALIQLYK
jgi:hypothetical protein